MPNFALARPASSLLLTLALLSACAASDDDAQTEPLARVHVAPAQAGVAAAASIEDDSLTLYVCGSGSTLDTHTRWFFSLPLRGDDSFEGTAEGWQAAGERDGDSIRVTLTDPDGLDTTLDFDAATGTAGLYTFDSPGCITGLVAWDDADAAGGLGVQGAWCDGAGAFGQVIILAPDAFTADGGEGRVEDRDDLGTFTLRPF
ncbi:MAG: hypothetical protein AAGA54_21825 [Myxococcota bacterium]